MKRERNGGKIIRNTGSSQAAWHIFSPQLMCTQVSERVRKSYERKERVKKEEQNRKRGREVSQKKRHKVLSQAMKTLAGFSVPLSLPTPEPQAGGEKLIPSLAVRQFVIFFPFFLFRNTGKGGGPAKEDLGSPSCKRRRKETFPFPVNVIG